MLSAKVYDICAIHHECTSCPLYTTCAMLNDEMPGATLAEKTAYWEARMNEMAEGVAQ